MDHFAAPPSAGTPLPPAPPTPPAAPRGPSRGRRTLRGLAVGVVLLAALAALIGIGAWLWSGSAQSLAQTMQLAARQLPAGQSLQIEGVNGTLREGGRIARLRWERNGLSVEARDVVIAWAWPRLPALLRARRLELQTLDIGQLGIDDRSPPSAQAFVPPADLTLPLALDVPLRIGTLTVAGPTALQASGMAAHYRFDGSHHTLDLAGLQLAAGHYRGTARLLARAPLTLDVQLQGEVSAPLPGTRQPLPLTASATVHGPLGGADALLALQAQLQPAQAGASTPMQATVSASVAPWAAQPVHEVHADFARLNVAALWPGQPQTLLTGQIDVTPVSGPPAAWRVRSQIANALPGPLDRQRLPVQRLQIDGVLEASRLNVTRLEADAAGGRVDLQGQWVGVGTAGITRLPSTGWQGTVTASGINPAAVHSQIAPAMLDGKLVARAEPGAIVFDAQLQPAARQPANSALQGLQLTSAHVQGRWRGGLGGALQLQALQATTPDARLDGQLDIDLASRATRGTLRLTLPGAQADVAGHLSAADGTGEWTLRVSDAAPALRWLASLPGGAAAVGPLTARGNGSFTGRWRGGWQGGGSALQLDAQLRAPLLDLTRAGQPPEAATRLRDLQADLSGRLSAFTLRADGQIQTGTRRSQIQAQTTGGLATGNANPGKGPPGSSGAAHWQGQVQALTLASQDTVQPGTWTVRLSAPVTWGWVGTASVSALQIGAGAAALSGPVAGDATLSWQATRYARDGARTTLQSTGQLQGVPLGWLEVLGDTQLAQLGLRGSLVFDGDWDIALAERLQVRASLARRSGDLSLLADDDSASADTHTGAVAGAATGIALPTVRGAPVAPPRLISAGVREARLSLTGDGEALHAALRWDSEHAGQAEATLSTRLQRVDGGWIWPADAPLSGTLKARLPRVGVWSVLAPPGWRIRGTLDASATLAGTRQAPLWRGTLQADDLAVRSVVEGIAFSDGVLRATLNGQRLDIDTLSLHGAAGGGGSGRRARANSGGGELTGSGFAEWRPATAPRGAPSGTAAPDGAAAPPGVLSRIHMALDVQAKALRVSARADRRLVVSGQVRARLTDAQLEIRGNLQADQALFVLPDENAPSLGSDVTVRTGGRVVWPTTSTPPAGSTATAVRVMPDVSVTLDLGRDFQVQGRGLKTRLAGQLQLRSNAATAYQPRLQGEVRTVRGTYKAYGQQLDIEEGVLRFSGPFDNPSLDILAIRPNLSQRVGVQISGTVLSPRVRLYASPELPEVEKLAWLVLGRSAANGGAESAVLQQAAMALLGGNKGGLSGGLASALGLDELSLRGAATAGDGTTSAAAVTLGKRITRDFYVAYERSLAGALGTFFVFYDLTKRFTLRAQSGQQSAVDLIFTVPYD